jgi:hypothetical protein
MSRPWLPHFYNGATATVTITCANAVPATAIYTINLFSFISHSKMTAAATSVHIGNEAASAIDDDTMTYWHTEWNPMANLPQSITLTLDRSYSVSALQYVPRREASGPNGIVTGYSIQTSVGTGAFTEVAKGTWADNFSTKSVVFSPVTASNVRLLVTAGHGGFASAAEINILGTGSSTGVSPVSQENSRNLQISISQATGNRGEVRINTAGPYRLEIAGLDGRVVAAIAGGAAAAKSISLPQLKPGLYIARLHSGDTIIGKLLIIARKQ